MMKPEAVEGDHQGASRRIDRSVSGQYSSTWMMELSKQPSEEQITLCTLKGSNNYIFIAPTIEISIAIVHSSFACLVPL